MQRCRLDAVCTMCFTCVDQPGTVTALFVPKTCNNHVKSTLSHFNEITSAISQRRVDEDEVTYVTRLDQHVFEVLKALCLNAHAKTPFATMQQCLKHCLNMVTLNKSIKFRETLRYLASTLNTFCTLKQANATTKLPRDVLRAQQLKDLASALSISNFTSPEVITAIKTKHTPPPSFAPKRARVEQVDELPLDNAADSGDGQYETRDAGADVNQEIPPPLLNVDEENQSDFSFGSDSNQEDDASSIDSSDDETESQYAAKVMHQLEDITCVKDVSNLLPVLHPARAYPEMGIDTPQVSRVVSSHRPTRVIQNIIDVLSSKHAFSTRAKADIQQAMQMCFAAGQSLKVSDGSDQDLERLKFDSNTTRHEKKDGRGPVIQHVVCPHVHCKLVFPPGETPNACPSCDGGLLTRAARPIEIQARIGVISYLLAFSRQQEFMAELRQPDTASTTTGICGQLMKVTQIEQKLT